MTRKVKRFWVLVPVLALSLGFLADEVHSEITQKAARPAPAEAAAEPLAKAAPEAAEAPRGVPGEEDAEAPAKEDRTAAIAPGALRVQCWQEGVKIIDEPNLYGIRLRNLIQGDTLGLRGRDAQNGDVYIVPVNDATCLIRPMK